MSLAIDSFIQQLAAGEMERLSRPYWEMIERIDRESSNEFIDFFRSNSGELDESRERVLVGVLSDLVYEKGSDYSELYPLVFEMMYNYYNCKPSIPYRYILILLQMDSDKDRLFELVVGHTGVNNVDSVCISIFSLYTSLGELSRFERAKVTLFLDIVISCLKRTKSKKLAAAVDEILMPLVGSREYSNYYNRFALMNSALTVC